VRKFLPLVLALVLIAPLSLVSYAVQAYIPTTVTTLPATEVKVTTATLNGTISIDDNCREGQIYFEYGTSPNDLGTSVFVDDFDHNQAITENFYANLDGLRPCTTYYARAVVVCNKVGMLPENKVLAGFGLDPVTLPAQLFARDFNITGEVISFRTLCPPVNDTSSSGGGVTMGSTIRPFLPPMFEIPSATVSATKASPGEQVEVIATITNKGGSNGTTKVILYVNGQEADSKGIALASGQSTPISFKVSRNDPGTYQVYVNGTSAGTFTVDLFNSNDMLIYASVALFVIGMIGLLYYLMKRRTTA